VSAPPEAAVLPAAVAGTGEKVAASRPDAGPAHAACGAARDDRHIVDVLIEERAGAFAASPRLWRQVRRLVKPLLGYRQAVALMDAIAPLPALDVFQHLSQRLSLRVAVGGAEHVPRSGRVIVIANHPTGIADGVAVFDALHPLRPDLAFIANRDAVRVAPGLADMIVPVEWRAHLRTRGDTRAMAVALSRTMAAGRALVVFPSGRLARPSLAGLVERPWLPTALSLALRYECPLLPLHIGGRNSALFYLFWLTSQPLRDMALFRELLNKREEHYRLQFGPPIDARSLPADLERATRLLERHVASGARGAFAAHG
jgi:putative hemolysin